MKVQGSQVIPGTTERVYDLLLDPAVLAACMPGCQELVRVEDGLYKMKMKLAIPAFSGDFSATVRISEAVRPAAFQMTIDGAGRLGHIKGDGRIRLSGAGDSTTVDYEGDVQVGGTMAAVGQRLIDTTSKMMIRNFSATLYGGWNPPEPRRLHQRIAAASPFEQHDSGGYRDIQG